MWPMATSNTVSVFAPGSTTPSSTLTGLNDPQALAFDASGDLYVSNTGSTTVSVFSKPAPAVPTAGGVVIRNAQPGQPINVGAASGTGLSLSDAELGRIFTVAGGTITIGDPSQTGNITFAGATPATTPGANLAVIQATTGGGAIVLDSSAGTALAVGTGNVQLSAGTGGIVATGAASSLATSGQVSLDTTGGIGTSTNRVLFDAEATPASVTIGSASPPGAGVYLGGLGSLTLGGVTTANSPLDVTAAVDLTVAPNVVLESGTATLALAAGINPDGSSASAGVLSIAAGADVVSEDSGDDAITLSGTDINIATGVNPAIVGAHRTQSNPTTTNLTELEWSHCSGSGHVRQRLRGQPRRRHGQHLSRGRHDAVVNLSTGLDSPQALAFDSSGNLYVVNSGNSTVSVIALNTLKTTSTLTGLNGPTALAFDGKRQPVCRQLQQRHGERVRTERHDADLDAHRAQRSHRAGLRLERQPLRRQQCRQHGECIRAERHDADFDSHRARCVPWRWPSTQKATCTSPTATARR